MPDQPGEHPPLPVAKEPQPEIHPAESYSPPSADGGENPGPIPHNLMGRSQLRAAIRAVYRAPHPTPAPEPEAEEPPAEPEEELLPQNTSGKNVQAIEEYSIPAPAEFTPKEEKREKKRAVRHFIIPPALPKVMPSLEPAEEADPNPTLIEEATLSTAQLETYAQAPSGTSETTETVAPSIGPLQAKEKSEAKVVPPPATVTPAPTAKLSHEDELERAARAQALVTKARMQARQGNFDVARRLFGQAITHDPNNAEAWTWLGGLLAEVNLDRAKVCLTRAIELDATNDRANRGLAEVNKKLEERARLEEEATATQPEQETEAGSRAIVLARPEIKIGLEEVIDKQRRSGIEADPESIPLGGARFGPAIESGELKPERLRRPRLGKVPVAIGLILLVGILVALIWLGPLNHGGSDTANSSVYTGINSQPGNATQTQAAGAGAAPAGSDAAFALKIRLEIDHYNRFFLNARDLRSQIQANKITWEQYAASSKQLQTDIKAEKKTLDNLAVETTPKLIQFYRELQNIAAITGTAMDFTTSGIDNVSPEDLEDGNRQFNDAASHLTSLLALLNQQVPLTGQVPTSNITPAATLPVPVSGAAEIGSTPVSTVVLQIGNSESPSPTPNR